MPNWCDCELTITGDSEEIERFKNFAKTEDNILDTEKFIPYPEEYKTLDKAARKREEEREKAKQEGKNLAEINEKLPYLKDGFNRGGYDWCRDNWGTKWGICHAELVNEDETNLNYCFDTAWSPPLRVIEKMGTLFPKLKITLKYYEGGVGFSGTFKVENGKATLDKEKEYTGNRGG